MSFSITTNLPRQKKDMQGGLSKVYLFEWTSYSFTNFTFDDQELTSFPATTIYDYNSWVSNFSETTERENGAVGWNQSFTLQFPKTMLRSEIYKLVKKDYRAIYVDRLGNIRILGLYNGLEASITNETGGTKSDFNGYRVSFTGKEDNQAYFLDSIASVGFTIYTVNNKVFMDGCNAIMENGNNYIYQ